MLVSDRACHWLSVPSGCPCHSLYMSNNDSSGWCLVGCCSLFTWRVRDMGRDMEKSPGGAVGVVSMMPSLVAAERWRER